MEEAKIKMSEELQNLKELQKNTEVKLNEKTAELHRFKEEVSILHVFEAFPKFPIDCNLFEYLWFTWFGKLVFFSLYNGI